MKLYNDYSSYLKSRYGCKVYRIGLDAGFTCPNRCLYCNNEGSRASYTDPKQSVSNQLKKRINYFKDKKNACKFIAYFQAFTNTYAAPDKLKKMYDEILPFEDVVGLAIGTRPDEVDEEKLRLISSYAAKYEVWLEYGLQSSHDRTLKSINRGHIFKDFVNAVTLTKNFPVKICAHVIIGLPGETGNDMIETARALNKLNIDSVKIHLLHILKGSAFEKMYRDGDIRLLSLPEYAGLVCDFLENLSPDVIIQRITGEGSRDNHVAPKWAMDKTAVINKIKETFGGRGSYQGAKLSSCPL